MYPLTEKRFGGAIALLVVALLVGCGAPSRSSNAQPQDSSAGPRPAVSPASAVPPTAARSMPQVPPGLAGVWSLKAENRPAGVPRLDLAIDSASGDTFRVRLAFLMQGDVGIEPQRFEPTRGAIGGDGLVHLTVKLREQVNPVGEMTGALERDTIRLKTYRWAGEDQMAGGTRWVLVRQPS